MNVRGPARSPASGRRPRALGALAALALAAGTALVAVQPAAAAATARVDNPYAGATTYVNPDWSALAAAEPGGDAVADEPTFVWLDQIAAIEGTAEKRGLREHLDTALDQGADLVQLVIYDLPGRDCSALASNGELGPTEIDRYESDYIDPIAAILDDPAYASLRIVTLIEPDSLPNLVTNAGGTAGSTEACATMKANGNYEKGVGYALHTLGAIPNVYNYVDAAHHGWLGWDSNLVPAAQEFKKAATTSGATVNDVAGFIVNTANYSATTEPYLKITDSVNGQTVRQSKWLDWNQYADEQTFAQGLRTALIAQGFDSGIGMLIDTSRNGWGGSARPTAPSTATTVDGFVDGSRTDRRIHAGNWCNQSGAGLGQRPAASPAAGIDAYVWAKPPGESDGSSKAIDNDEGKGFDRMCDPTYTGNGRNGNNMSGALADAPVAGHWFSAQFRQLLANAYPAVGSPGGGGDEDTQAPSVPTGLKVTGTTASSVSLSWSASTDNKAVTGYDVYRDGTKLTTTSATSYTDSGLKASTAYAYTVRAKDAAGNVSAASASVTGTTAASGGGGGTGACAATWKANTWSGGFQADVTLKNTGDKPLTAWKATFTVPSGTAVTNAWSATVAVSGTTATATHADYNADIPAGGSVSFGYQGTGTYAAPTAVTVNGQTCTTG